MWLRVQPFAILSSMELGLATFADVSAAVSPQQRMSDLMEEAELADQLGLDVFAIGEHHRPDFLISSPAVALAAAAMRTAAHPPVERGHGAELRRPRPRLPGFRRGGPPLGRACGDHGRSRLVHRVVPAVRLRPRRLRRASTPRSSSCCSRSATASTSRGPARHRAPLTDAGVWPRPVQERLPIWVAVGGSPQSVVRAATLGLPLTIAIIGGAAGALRPVRRAVPRGVGARRPRSAATRRSRSTPTPSSARRPRRPTRRSRPPTSR